jgi:putative ABC transport system permease protein
MTPVLLDLRVAIRQAIKRPSFSLLVIATLSLTIGAATFVFSLFDAVLLRPLSFRDPERLVRIQTLRPNISRVLGDVSLYDFQDWQRQSRAFESLAATFSFNNNLTGRGPAQSLRMTFATPELFDLLGARPLIGRTFTAAENHLGGDVLKIVLSYAQWQQLFAARPDALDQTLHLRGQTYTVIGVMPPGFRYPDRTDVWVPLMARYSSYAIPWWQRRDARVHQVFGRLADGVTLAQAQREMDAVAASIGETFPDTNREIQARVQPLRQADAGAMEPYVRVVGAAVLVLLLIGCVNVASLFIARAASRERELTIRAALGSSVSALVRQLMVESLIVAIAGAAGGLAMASLGVANVTRLIPVELPSVMALRIDGRVLAFSAAVSLGAALVFGLAPLLQWRRPDLTEALKHGAKGSSGGARWLRRALVVAEVALSVVLLVGAGLMLRSLARLLRVETGIHIDHLVVASGNRYVANIAEQQMLVDYADQFRRVRDRLPTVPGVVAASAATDLPYVNQQEQRPHASIYTRDRSTREQALQLPTKGAGVMPGYFHSAGIPLLEGRDLTEADTLGAREVVVISRSLAERLFPGRPAVGEHMRWGNDPPVTIVGVVADTRWSPAETVPGFEVYWPYRQYLSPDIHFVVRTAADPESLLPLIRTAIQDASPEFALRGLKTMERIADESVWQRRVWGWVLGAFAGAAMLLASVGLYGVMSYLVAQRTREIGIQLAIGASRRRILQHVLSDGLSLGIIGGLLGLVVAAASSRAIAAVLWDVRPLDPLTYASVFSAMLLVVTAACLAPAWRAARVDPLVALRQE